MEQARKRRAAKAEPGMNTDTRRGEIHLGDLVTALVTLNCQTDEQARAIARCLGFDWSAAPPAAPTAEIYDRQRYPKNEQAQKDLPVRPPVYAPPAPPPPVALPDFTAASHLELLSERAPAEAETPPDWLDDAVDAPPETEASGLPARRSLFHERTHRHLLSAALGVRRTGSEIDLARLIGSVCRREVIAQIPRMPEATLDLGCDVLLDYSATMVPYWEDLGMLTEQVKRVVGQPATRAYSFDGQPDNAMSWTPDGERVPWKADGRTVLVATDFGVQGLAGRATAGPSWMELVDRCTKAGSPLVILVIWPESRWPQNLGRTPRLVHWSPHTTAAMLRKRIGAGHKVG